MYASGCSDRPQLDIPFAGNHFVALPKHLPGRTNADDLVFFIWPREMDASAYSVIVETLDTSGGRYRNIGPLMSSVQLPLVHFGWESQILVIPNNNPALPRFAATLQRGSTFIIPSITGCSHRGGTVYSMQRLGVGIITTH